MKRLLIGLVFLLAGLASASAAPIIVDDVTDTVAINGCSPKIEPCVVTIFAANYYVNQVDGTPNLPGKWPGFVVLAGPKSFAGMPPPDWWSGADHFQSKIVLDPQKWHMTEQFGRQGFYVATWAVVGDEGDNPFTPIWCNENWQICRDAGRPAHGSYGEYALVRADLRNTGYPLIGFDFVYQVTHPACVNSRGSELHWPHQPDESSGNCYGN